MDTLIRYGVIKSYNTCKKRSNNYLGLQYCQFPFSTIKLNDSLYKIIDNRTFQNRCFLWKIVTLFENHIFTYIKNVLKLKTIYSQIKIQ